MFPCEYCKHFKNTYLDENLPFLLLTVSISSWGLYFFLRACNSIGLLQRSSSTFKEFSSECLVEASSLIWKKEKLAETVTRCHSLYHSLSLVLIRCHSLSFVVTRCTTRFHSLSLDVLLVCLFINDRCFPQKFVSNKSVRSPTWIQPVFWSELFELRFGLFVCEFLVRFWEVWTILFRLLAEPALPFTSVLSVPVWLRTCLIRKN